jgi:hypothetical protein
MGQSSRRPCRTSSLSWQSTPKLVISTESKDRPGDPRVCPRKERQWAAAAQACSTISSRVLHCRS